MAEPQRVSLKQAVLATCGGCLAELRMRTLEAHSYISHAALVYRRHLLVGNVKGSGTSGDNSCVLCPVVVSV